MRACRFETSAAAAVGRLLPAFLTMLVLACSPPQRDERLPVVAVSVPPLAWFVQRLAGDRVKVEIMIPPGANHHAWEPSLEQMRAASKAALYVKIGHPHFTFEQTWLRRLVEANASVHVVDCSAGIDGLEEDPHLWVSPATARRFVPALAAALKEVLPDAHGDLDSAQTALLASIDALDADVRRILAPAEGKRFYVFHPAWGYLARDYGLVQVSIEHGAKEPGAAELARLMRDARADGAEVIFVQPEFSSRSARVVADEIGAKLVSLDPLALDWPVAIRHAAEAIATSLESGV